jgi:hypothetical protein
MKTTLNWPHAISTDFQGAFRSSCALHWDVQVSWSSPQTCELVGLQSAVEMLVSMWRIAKAGAPVVVAEA